MDNNVNASLLISTCDKFSDLWDAHISLYKKYWPSSQWKTYLITDQPTTKSYDDIEIIVADGNLDFPMRIKYALDFIETEYVLLTLDDYFLIENVKVAELEYLVKRANEDHIDYLMLYNRRITNPNKYKSVNMLIPIDLTQRYAVTLYPAIWNKEFLYHSVKSDMSPWQFEPSLTSYASENQANCKFSCAGTFIILDVVRKGKILYKAKRYLEKNNIDLGQRECNGILFDIKEFLIDRIRWYTPKTLFRFGKKIAKKMGMHFYSAE